MNQPFSAFLLPPSSLSCLKEHFSSCDVLFVTLEAVGIQSQTNCINLVMASIVASMWPPCGLYVASIVASMWLPCGLHVASSLLVCLYKLGSLTELICSTLHHERQPG